MDSHAHPDEAALSWGLKLEQGAQGPAASGARGTLRHTLCTMQPHKCLQLPRGMEQARAAPKLGKWWNSHGNVERRAKQPNLGVPTMEWDLLSALMPKHEDLRLQVNTCSHLRAWSIISKEVWMLKQALDTCELPKGLQSWSWGSPAIHYPGTWLPQAVLPLLIPPSISQLSCRAS